MSKQNQNTELELWSQIQEQFQKLVAESGVDLNSDYQEEIASALGISSEDLVNLEKETVRALTTKHLKVHKIHPDAVVPKYAYPSDSGFDLHSTEEITIPAFGRALIPTGLRFQFDEGFEIQVRPKSGLAINEGLTVLNTPGTVDQGYSGEIKVPVFNTNNFSFKIKKGMKVAQGVLCPVISGKFVEIQEVGELDGTDRGNKGFGSTGI